MPDAQVMKGRARSMRNSPTDSERIVWRMINRDQLGVGFRRQFRLGDYIVDFVCFSKRLIVEIDGSQHADNAYDARRDAWLRSQGFEVVRLWNSDVYSDPESVGARIAHEVNRR